MQTPGPQDRRVAGGLAAAVLAMARALPAGIGGVAILAGALFTVAGATSAIDVTGYGPLRPLMGVTVPVHAAATVGAVLDGTFQSVVARSVGPSMPLFPGAVRLRNQIDYSVFGVAGDPGLVVGRHGELFQTDYVTEYCSRSIAASLPFFRAWAAAIRQMQDAAERRGQTFLYVLTPSKAAQYPGLLPPGMPCPAASSDRLGLVPAWTGLLAAAGVHWVDTTATLRAAHGQYPFDLYPTRGIHWNAVGRHLGGQAVAAGIEGLRHDHAFPAVPFTWHLAPAVGSDTDIGQLMNTLRPLAGAPMPVVAVQPPPASACPVKLVVIVGGSFGDALGEHLSEEPCHPAVVKYGYWTIDRLSWANGAPTYGPVDPEQRTVELDEAEILIYETNEQVLNAPSHGDPFYRFLVGHPFVLTKSPA